MNKCFKENLVRIIVTLTVSFLFLGNQSLVYGQSLLLYGQKKVLRTFLLFGVNELEIEKKNRIINIEVAVIIVVSFLAIFTLWQLIKSRRLNKKLRTLSSIVEQTDNFAMLTKPNGEFEWVNAAFSQVYGYTREEIKGGKPKEMLVGPKTDQEMIIESIEQVYEHKRSISLQILNYTKEGKEIWVRINTKPILTKKGHIKNVLSVGEEVTELVRKQEEIQLKKQEYEYIINGVDDLIFRADVKGRFTFINHQMELFSGYSREEIIGSNYMEYVHPDYQETIKWFYRELIKNPETSSTIDFQAIDKHQKIRWVELRATVTYDEKGISGYQGIVRDITQRKEIEDKLRQNDLRFTQVFEKSSDLIHVLDSNGRFIYVNQAWKEKLGYNDRQVANLGLDDILHPQHQLKSAVIFGSDMTRYKVDQGHTSFETKFIAKDDTEVNVIGSNIPTNIDGEITVTGIFHDITFRKNTEKQLQDALEVQKELNQTKTTFITNASHEFRTPLTIIQSNVELLKHYIEPTSKNKAKIDKIGARIENEILSITNILNDLLAMGKVEQKKVSLEEIDVLNHIKKNIESTKMLFPDKNGFKLQVVGTPSFYKTDRFILDRILLNLFSNALKYSENSNKHAEIVVRFETDGILIKIQDYGIGIPKSELKNLYQPFFRASNVGKIKGSGLGLSVVYEYISLLNLKLDIESEVGKGTSFYLKLPFNTNTRK